MLIKTNYNDSYLSGMDLINNGIDYITTDRKECNLIVSLEKTNSILIVSSIRLDNNIITLIVDNKIIGRLSYETIDTIKAQENGEILFHKDGKMVLMYEPIITED